MAEIYNFDDFFIADNDAGMTVEVELSGKTVPLVLKRKLTLKDIEEAKAASVKTRVRNNTMELVSVDESEFTIQVLLRSIQSWPFTFADGTPVPVTRLILEKMMSDGAQALSALVLDIVQGRKDATIPFVPASVEP